MKNITAKAIKIDTFQNKMQSALSSCTRKKDGLQFASGKNSSYKEEVKGSEGDLFEIDPYKESQKGQPLNEIDRFKLLVQENIQPNQSPRKRKLSHGGSSSLKSRNSLKSSQRTADFLNRATESMKHMIESLKQENKLKDKLVPHINPSRTMTKFPAIKREM